MTRLTVNRKLSLHYRNELVDRHERLVKQQLRILREALIRTGRDDAEVDKIVGDMEQRLRGKLL